MAPSSKQTLKLPLEGELQSEIQLPHRCVWREAGDQPRTGAGVDAIVWVIEVHMIEDIEGFKPELCSEPLCYGKVLESDISELKKLGPVNAFRPLPSAPVCGR